LKPPEQAVFYSAMDTIEKFLSSQAEVALMEDIGPGDITTLGCIEDKAAKAEITAKTEGILAGLPLVEAVFRKLDETINIEIARNDGDKFSSGDRILVIKGNSRTIITGERTALNFLGRLSGIATLTGEFVKKIKGTGAIILDTRKTTPGIRHLEKYAVACGGGQNHRFGLFDMVLIKDNHIAACGSITKAVEKVRRYLKSEEFKGRYVINPSEVVIEVEIENKEQLLEAINCGVKRLLLDNQSISQLSELVGIARRAASDLKLEASGNITLKNVAAVAGAGVDYISIGALTHSALSSDFSLGIVS
jgi:nicotinate-nucleotide pyrophosphorylase (carboxylating)